MMRPITLSLLLLALLPALGPGTDVRGQTWEPVLGGAGGFLAGTTVTLGLIVFDAQLERDFLESPLELIGPRGAPIVAGTALGAGVGLGDPDLLRDLGQGAGLGFLIGGAIGAVTGWIWTNRAEGPWIGGTLGAAGGVMIGLVAGAYFLDDPDPPDDGLVILRFSVPAAW